MIWCCDLCLVLFLYQLYSINYPSLRDNNILRRVLVCEVLYWAEKLKRRCTEEKTGETLFQTEGGAEECVSWSERYMEVEKQKTGDCPDSWDSWKSLRLFFSVPLVCFFFLTEWTHSSLWSRDKQFSGAVWQTFVRGSGWREGRVVSEKQSGTTGVLLQTEQVCINLRKMSKGTESETAVFGLISVASVPLSGCEDAGFPPVVVSWHSVGRYLGQLLLICLCLCTFLI